MIISRDITRILGKAKGNSLITVLRKHNLGEYKQVRMKDYHPNYRGGAIVSLLHFNLGECIAFYEDRIATTTGLTSRGARINLDKLQEIQNEI